MQRHHPRSCGGDSAEDVHSCPGGGQREEELPGVSHGGHAGWLQRSCCQHGHRHLHCHWTGLPLAAFKGDGQGWEGRDGMGGGNRLRLGQRKSSFFGLYFCCCCFGGVFLWY